jgi:small subunit ribosomal protein S8
MKITDPIGDYLTRIRNAQQAGHRTVDIPASNLKLHMTEILYENGYILKYTVDNSEYKQGVIKIALKYNPKTRKPIIQKLERISRPGLRQYRHVEAIPRVLNGLGIAIMSTSKGVITDKKARELNVGGEILCIIH